HFRGPDPPLCVFCESSCISSLLSFNIRARTIESTKKNNRPKPHNIPGTVTKPTGGAAFRSRLKHNLDNRKTPEPQTKKKNMSQYNKLYTAHDSAVVFIDHQPQMLFGVGGIDRAAYINNVVLLAKAAKEFKVPTVLTAVETEGFSGYVYPQLLDVFPGQEVVERSSMN